MKKQLFLMSALALTALTSCGGKSGGGLKVGLICLHDTASTYDKNFIDAFTASCEDAKKKGFVTDYRYVTGIEEDQSCADAAEQLIADGFNVIFTDSFGHDAFIHTVAKDHPNVFFSSATGIEARNADLPNFHNAFASIYEGRYLAGVAAGQYLIQEDPSLATADFNVGYVGAKPYAEVISGYTSWFLGVRSVCQNVKMKVIYTNSWYDENAERVAAETLINAPHNCKLISQHADSMGAPTACRIKRIPNVSYNMNTVEMDPQCANTYVAHSRINWKPYYDNVLQLVHGQGIKGEVEQNWTGNLSDGSVEYNVGGLLDETHKNAVKAVEDQIKSGSLHVFDTSKFTVQHLPEWASQYGDFPPVEGEHYTVDGSYHLLTMKADTTDDYVRDTDLVTSDKYGSYINESFFRSAPSFDFIIDGISII